MIDLILPKKNSIKANENDFRWYRSDRYLNLNSLPNEKYAEVIYDRITMANYACMPHDKSRCKKMIEFFHDVNSGLLCFSSGIGFSDSPVRQTRVRELTFIQRELIGEFDKVNEFYESAYAEINGKGKVDPKLSLEDLMKASASETISDLLLMKGVSHSLVLSLDIDCDEKTLVKQVEILVQKHKEKRNLEISEDKNALKKSPKRRILEENKIVQLLDIHIYSKLEKIAPSYPLIADLLSNESAGNADEYTIANAVKRYLTPLLEPQKLKAVMYEICSG